jgi:hypothetical protein
MPRTKEIVIDCVECGTTPNEKAFVLGNNLVCHGCAAPAFVEDCPYCFNSRYTWVQNAKDDINCAFCDGVGYVAISGKGVTGRLMEVTLA